jgi:tRNA uridine 5-carboxymethylaminomethyl modification enzyme
MKIPLEINYYEINSISNEVREKLSKIRPVTIAAASKIQGITPASIMAILIHLKKNLSKNKSINPNNKNF